MGILNATSDSFYKGYLAGGTRGMVELAGKMLQDGANIIDIGGQSTRPGRERVGIDEELNRVLPVIGALHSAYPSALISVDTYQSEIARAAVDAGAHIINDISGGTLDKDMIKTVGSLNVPYICMHMKGAPQTMQDEAHYTNITLEVLAFFTHKLSECREAGIRDMIADPGFGFAKTASHNFALLSGLSIFKSLGVPILAGISRKSTIYKTLKISVNEALNGSTVLHTIALLNGANMLRVHDVKEAVEAVKLVEAYREEM